MPVNQPATQHPPGRDHRQICIMILVEAAPQAGPRHPPEMSTPRERVDQPYTQHIHAPRQAAGTPPTRDVHPAAGQDVHQLGVIGQHHLGRERWKERGSSEEKNLKGRTKNG